MRHSKAHRQTTVTGPVRRPGHRARQPVALAGSGAGKLVTGPEIERHGLPIGPRVAQVPAVDRELDPAGVADLHGHRVLEVPGAGAAAEHVDLEQELAVRFGELHPAVLERGEPDYQAARS